MQMEDEINGRFRRTVLSWAHFRLFSLLAGHLNKEESLCCVSLSVRERDAWIPSFSVWGVGQGAADVISIRCRPSAASHRQTWYFHTPAHMRAVMHTLSRLHSTTEGEECVCVCVCVREREIHTRTQGPHVGGWLSLSTVRNACHVLFPLPLPTSPLSSRFGFHSTEKPSHHGIHAHWWLLSLSHTHAHTNPHTRILPPSSLSLFN